jgi:hypothetical protein
MIPSGCLDVKADLELQHFETIPQADQYMNVYWPLWYCRAMGGTCWPWLMA